MANTPTTTDLGRRLRQLREERTWSRRTLADRSGTSEASIARTELYGHTPKLETLNRWAHTLEVGLGDLLEAA